MRQIGTGGVVRILRKPVRYSVLTTIPHTRRHFNALTMKSGWQKCFSVVEYFLVTINIEKSEFPTLSAPSPHFAWKVGLPSNWAFLDSRPHHVDKSIDGILADFYRPDQLTDDEKRLIKQMLHSIASEGQRIKAHATLMLPLAHNQKEGSVNVLYICWINHGPALASIYNTRLYLDDQKIEYEERTQPAGSKYFLTLTTSKSELEIAAIIPVPSSNWTLLIRGLTLSHESESMLRNVVIRIADEARFHVNERRLTTTQEITEREK